MKHKISLLCVIHLAVISITGCASYQWHNPNTDSQTQLNRSKDECITFSRQVEPTPNTQEPQPPTKPSTSTNRTYETDYTFTNEAGQRVRGTATTRQTDSSRYQEASNRYQQELEIYNKQKRAYRNQNTNAIIRRNNAFDYCMSGKGWSRKRVD